VINFTVFIFDNNAPLFSLSILQENAFLKNRIVIYVFNRLKYMFLRNKKNRKPESAVGIIFFEIFKQKGAFKLPPLK